MMDAITKERLERVERCEYANEAIARVLEVCEIETLSWMNDSIKGGLIAAIRELSHSASHNVSMIIETMHEDTPGR